jgi:hypothetical protein
MSRQKRITIGAATVPAHAPLDLGRWWHNLTAQPDAVARLSGQPPRAVRAREAVGAERERLWRLWTAVGDMDLDGYAAVRKTETLVVVLEPRKAAA